MDPNLWCARENLDTRYGVQIREADWIVLYKGLQGSPGRNDWKCRYLVSMQGPGNDLGNFTVPLPVTQTSPVDFRATCATQFSGARLRYAADTRPWPWQCIGQPGRYYPPPALRLATLARGGGYTAKGLAASGSGRLSLLMTTASDRRVASAARRRVLLAAGARVVRSAGRYNLRIRLTKAGRRMLTRARRLAVGFSVTFAPRTGRRIRLSGTAVLRR